MAAATKTAPKIQKARFEAEGTGLTITVKRNTEQYIDGKKQSMGDGIYVRFIPNGMGGQFYETTDAEMIDLLRAKSKGLDPKFFEVPIPTPQSGPVLSQIVGLTARGDIDGLVTIAKDEEDTWGREDVLNAVADALENLKP